MTHDEAETDRGRSWVVAACCCFCNLTFYGVARLSGLMLVAATHTFHVSRASAAVPFSLSTAIRNLAGLFVGHLGHRFGVGPVVAIGCLLASLGSGLCFFAQDMQWLTLCWGGLFGIGFGLCTCLLPLAINQYFTKHNGAAIGIAYSGSYIGSFIFPPIVVWLLNNFELQGTFLIISGGILNVLIAAMLLKKPKTVKKSLQETFYNGNVGQMFAGVTSECMSYSSKHNNVLTKDSSTNFPCCSQKVFIDERHNKFNMHPAISLENKLYSVSGNFSCLLKRGMPKMNGSVDCNLHPNIGDRQNYPAKIHHNLKRTFQTDSQCVNCYSTSETPKELILATSNSVTSENAVDSNKIPQCTETCFESSKGNSITISAKESHIVPKSCCKEIGLELRPLSKSKLKAKCKLRLHKLKKALENLKQATLQKRGHNFQTEFSPNTNVQLLSLKYFQPFLCSCPPSISESIKRKFLSSTGSNEVKRQRKGTTFHFMRKFNNYSFTLQKDKKMEESIFPRGTLKITEQTIYLPSLHNLYKNIDNYSLAEVQDNHSQNVIHVHTNTPPRLTHRSSFQTHAPCRDYELPILFNSKEGVGNTFRKHYISNTSKAIDTNYISGDISNLSQQCLDHNVGFKQNCKSVESPTPSPLFPAAKIGKKCLPDWCRMFCEPMFVVISFSMAIQTFIVVCVVTTIEDFAKDVGIPENKVHYAIMALSTANLVGTLTLGAITDRGFISRHRFLSLCFLGMSLSLTAVSLVPLSLASLLSLMAIHGLLESGVVITFPLLVRQFMEGERRQAVAIASSNALSAPAVMLVPLLIGHFRDNIGCYTGLFHLLGATSFTCCLVWLIAPSLLQRKSSKTFEVYQVPESSKK